jgi:multisubunit Na+/H+ antiporter MnhE subunit
MTTRARRIGSLAVRAAMLYLIWLLVDDNVSQPELYTGIVVALLALLLATVLKRAGSVHLQVQPWMLRYLYRVPLLLVTDSVRVCAVLIKALVLRRPVTGRFRAVRYDAGGDRPPDVARRALTEWSASMAPNRYVIGIDRSAGTLLVHELVETHGALDPLELG